MAITLFNLTYRVAELLNAVAVVGAATGGSTTTVVDTGRLADYDDDHFNKGTVWVLYDAGGQGAAPEGEYSEVSDFVQSTKTVTLLSAVSAAIASGDTYALGLPRFPLWLMKEKINSAVFLEGLIPVTDTTTITIATNQREYTLPAAASLDLRQVHIQTNKDTDRNIWIPVVNWEVEYSAGGTAEKLILAYDLEAGYKLKLAYVVQHGRLDVASDELNEVIHPDRICYDAAASCLRWYIDRTRLKHLNQTYNDLMTKAERAKMAHPMPMLPNKQRKIGLV